MASENISLIDSRVKVNSPLSGLLCRRLDLGDWNVYRRMMGPGWDILTAIAFRTRAYADGLEAALRLLAATERFRHRLTRAEYRRHQTRLYLFALTMLDRADRWEDYLMVWESILDRSDLTIRYSEESPDVHGPQMLPYIRRHQGQTVAVHFLYSQLHRKELIERKLAKASTGRRTGNLLHARAERLTGEEIKQRLTWIRERAEARTMEGKGGSP